MKSIVLSFAVIAFAILTVLAAETAKPGFVREPGNTGLGKKGSLLNIVATKDGRSSWSLTWVRDSAPVTITKADYFKGKGWFAFVESPARVWFFDGVDELMLAEETKNGISQQSALFKPVLDSCPPEVLKALPENVRKQLHEKSKG